MPKTDTVPGESSEAPPVPTLPTEGVEPSQIPAAPVEGEAPKRKRIRNRGKKAVEPAPAPASPVNGVPLEQVQALQNALTMTFKALSAGLVSWRGEMYKFRAVQVGPQDPEKVKAAEQAAAEAGGSFQSGLGQAEMLGAAWAIPLAPYFTGPNLPWLGAVVATVGVFGPMAMQDYLATKRAKEPTKEGTGPRLEP